MRPAAYLEHLELTAAREGLAASALRPCSSADVRSVEREVGLTLPEPYVDFLCQVGAGPEHGGLAVWFHLDMTRPANIIERSHIVMGQQARAMREAGAAGKFPRGFLVIYDACDETVYGFVPNTKSTFKPGVYCWDQETFELDEVAGDFPGFLDYLADAAL